MILTNRLFERVQPSKDAKSIFIFCEGAKREYAYFQYFKELDSRINIEVYQIQQNEDNSPFGLFKIAQKSIIKTNTNKEPKYNFIEGDEVWIVLDIDEDKRKSREPQINIIEKECNELDNWYLAKSNPCFEVWLYYHLLSKKPDLENSKKCAKWKQLVNNSIKGGFDSRKHPIFIETAIKNSINNFSIVDNKIDIGSTEVYKLAESIVPLIKSKIGNVLDEI